MLTELLPLMTYCLVMSGTPGPNNVMLTASGANFGYRGAMPHILGINLGVALQTAVMCLGLGGLFAAYPAAHAVLSVAGALYLLFLAWKLGAASVGEAGRLPRPVSFAQGLMFQAINPKSWVKAITLAAVFMPAGMDPAWAALLVAGVGLVIGFPCSSMWALFGVAIRQLLTDPRKHRVFNVLMAGSLALLALQLLHKLHA